MRRVASILVMLMVAGCAQQAFVYGPGGAIVPKEVVLAPRDLTPGLTLGARRTVSPSKRYVYQIVVRHIGDHWPPEINQVSIRADGRTILLNDPAPSISRRVLYGGRFLEDRTLPVLAADLRMLAAAHHVSIDGYGLVTAQNLSLLRDFVREHVE